MLKPCVYATIVADSISQIGGGSFVMKTCRCGMKSQGQQQMMNVYQALFEKGFEGSILNYNCPMADTGQWSECPFFEPAE